MSVRNLIDVPWIVCVLFWIIGAFRTRRTESKEPVESRLGVIVLLIAGYGLLFNETVKVGFLGKSFLQATLGQVSTGIILTWLGIGLALWSRWHLGAYWSGRIAIKEDHRLINTGPYARLRHPIYSGLDLAALGTAIAVDQWGCLVGVVLIAAAYWIKARREECMLVSRFGDAFEQHRQHTGFLLPKIRRQKIR